MRKFNFIMILLLIIGLTPNIYSSFGDEIVNDKPIINYNIEIISEEENNISFILDENTSFNDENSNKKFNVKEIKDLDTNINLSSLSYGVAKKDYYHFLIKYIDVNKQLEKSIDLIVKSENQKENLKKEKIVKNTNENILSFRTKQVSGFDYETDTFNTSEARNSYFEKTFNHVQNGEFEIINEVLDVTENATIIIPNEYQGRKIKLRDTGYVNYLFGTNIVKIIFENNGNKIYASADSSYLFGRNERLTEIKNLNNLDTSQVTNMTSMFQGCSVLTTLDVSGFDTSQATNMTFMFYGCSGLTTLDVSVFDTSQVTDMSYMFYGCSELTTLDVSRFDTSQATNISSMFSGCSRLTMLDVSGFDTSQVTNISGMFSGCGGLTKLDVSRFDTSQVTNMSIMFSGCRGLTTLDVSGFDTSQVTNMTSIFNNMSNVLIVVKDLHQFPISVNNTSNLILTFNNDNNYFKKIFYTKEEYEQINNLDNLKLYANELGQSWQNEKTSVLLKNEIKLPTEIAGKEGANYIWIYSYQISTSLGWQNEVEDSVISGNEAEDAPAINGLVIKSKNDAFNYGAKINNIGWQEVSTNQEIIDGNLETIKISLKEPYSNQYDVYYRVKTKGFGWLGWTSNGNKAGSDGYDDYIQAIQIKVINKDGEKPKGKETIPFINTQVRYKGQVQNVGWQDWLYNGAELGTVGLGLRLESMQIELTNTNMFSDANILYNSHVQNIGWEASEGDYNKYLRNGQITGTVGKGLRIEATQILLQGEISKYFDVMYRTQVENTGWLDWAENNQKSGSARYARRIETIQIKLVPKGLKEEFLNINSNPSQNKPSGVWQPFIEQQSVWYETHNAYEGWKEEQKDGNTAGSAINPIESLKINIDPANTYQGAVKYRVKETNGNWSDTQQNGKVAGTEGQGKTIEAFSVYIEEGSKLDHEFDIYYRALVDGQWLGYAKNGQVAGYEGKKITAISIMLVPKIIQYDYNEAYKDAKGEYVIINKEDIDITI